MTAAIRPLNITDMTGGLNLRADAFQLKQSESPDMLNVDVDPRGGVRSRSGWSAVNTSAVPSWVPKRLHMFEQSNGTRNIMLINGTALLTGTGATLAALSDATGAVTGNTTSVHSMDFVDWGDTLYMVAGDGIQSRSWSGSGLAVRLTANAPTWQDDYLTPVGGYMPSAEFACSYQGFMVVASTTENGTAFRTRIRFSHPNSPGNWKSTDFIDILGGGSRITGLVAFADHVVVFKSNSVWAIYGNGADTFTPVNITMAAGAIHRNALCVSERGAYFFSHPRGVHFYAPGEAVVEVSEQLRPIIDSGEVNPSALSVMSLGFLNRRLWWGCAYEKDAVATDARSVFVLDPSLDAWTLYRDASGDGLGPFATGGVQGTGGRALACHRKLGFVVVLDATTDGLDRIAVPAGVGFASQYTTGWQHAGWPSLRKAWRRPDYVVSEFASQWTLLVDVFRDYEETDSKSTHAVVVETGSGGGIWGTAVWGAGSWGGAARGAHLERGGSVGLARSVQFRFSGEVGKPWGLNAVVLKFRPRRLR